MTKNEHLPVLSTRWATGASRNKAKFRLAECEAAVGRAVRNRRVATQVIEQALADEVITEEQAAELREDLAGD